MVHCGAPVSTPAQQPPSVAWSAQAVPAWSRADPVAGGDRLDEIRVVQPLAMLHVRWGPHLRALGTLDLEGLTMPDGELTPGAWGEGFVDRRHPHTYVHELLLAGDDLLGSGDGAARLSLAAGKGFAPFGTDDPMTRPPLRYPVNHHLAQILERAVAQAGVRVGPVSVEAGVFNGDEPERPGQWPRLSRFGDSWSGRLTGSPVAGVELQGSYARVHSPEHRPGAGTDQHKWSLSGRWEGPAGGHPVYALIEWARTSEAAGFFVFHSLLAEGAWSAGRHRLYYRFERTERPEEERISDFRSRRPHLENSILGTTRWTIHTVGYSLEGQAVGSIRVAPLAELSAGSIGRVRGGIFDVAGLYGDDRFWSWSLGVRVSAGGGMHRMGRYGAAAEPSEESGHTHHRMGAP
jgi:hypothetical protein